MDIAFIGLGIMGSRMAANLLKHGHQLTVYNRTPAKTEPLAAQGARVAESPVQAVRQADVVITMLSDPPAVREVAEGPKGFLHSLSPGALWIDCSTVNPSFSAEMARSAWKRQVRLVDAPVSGTKGPAESGELIFLVGGDDEDVQAARPLLEAMGKKIVHVGGPGKGVALKMLFNLLLGQTMLAFSEALLLGESLGLDRKFLLDTLIPAPVSAPFLSYKRVKIESSPDEPDFALEWMQKDLQLVAQTGYEQGVALPSVNVAKEIYALAKQAGLGGQDFAAIYRFLSGQFREDRTGEDDKAEKAEYL